MVVILHQRHQGAAVGALGAPDALLGPEPVAQEVEPLGQEVPLALWAEVAALEGAVP